MAPAKAERLPDTDASSENRQGRKREHGNGEIQMSNDSKELMTTLYDGSQRLTAYRKSSKGFLPEEYKRLPKGPMSAMAFGVNPPLDPRSFTAEPGILCDRDVAVKMRDGITIYADIYRPDTSVKVPVILAWSFYGKRAGEGVDEWELPGVEPGAVSNMAKFEAPDPLFWCRYGYAVANVDPRGVGHSEGNISFYGSQDARDGYDFIEWIAAQPWCSGKVGMAGTSALAMVQWAIAAQQPPHLACIAPWEGTSDLFRESVFEGGIPSTSFAEHMIESLAGPNYTDDMAEMARKEPFMSDYWKDKIADWKKISIPCYSAACWCHFHLRGSFQAFRHISSEKKWFRAHSAFEWPDFYSKEAIADLKLFFDRYLLGIRNGWESTPRYRLDVQDAYDVNFREKRPETDFPLERTRYEKLYLHAENGTLSGRKADTESSCTYDSQCGEATFAYRFSEDTEITGYAKLHLWVRSAEHDEMDLFVNIRKLSADGTVIPMSVLGCDHPGTWGKLRVSWRELSDDATEFQPIQSFRQRQKIRPGEAVPVDIEIVPMSRFWHAGQSIQVQIAGRYIREGWFEPLEWETDNRGGHEILTGGEYDSYLQIPVIPPRFSDGDVIYR